MDESSTPERVPLVPQQQESSDPEQPTPTLLTDSADIRVADEEQQATAEGSSLEMDEWNRKMDNLQRISLVVAHLMAIVVVVLTFQWVSQLGGLSWQKGHAKLIFNWHPLLMILSFCFMTVSSLSFRYQRLGLVVVVSRPFCKFLHGIGWAIAASCMVVGVMAAFFSHNDRHSGFIANLYSLHSWVGITVLLLYTIQFLVGAGAFALDCFAATTKAKILQVHAFFGPILYVSVMLTILLGIQEKEGFIGCGYKVDEPDMVPFKHFSEIPAICKQSHSMGFSILAMGLCTIFTLHQMERTKRRQH